MTSIPIFQVDAFTSQVFGGNPAAVCLLPAWPASDEVLQNIAMENNLSETAFIVKNGHKFEIRWFTPRVEVDLCGHATLASAHIVFTRLDPERDFIAFESRQYGTLKVNRKEDLITLDFPSLVAKPVKPNPEIVNTFGINPEAVLEARDLMVVFETEDEIRSLIPDMDRLKKLSPHAVIVTAPGNQVDFVSRFFAPNVGIPEDPVTGSAHTTLVPYWSKRLGKNQLRALQLSRRGGELFCEQKEDRVMLSGRAVTYLTGEIFLPKTLFTL